MNHIGYRSPGKAFHSVSFRDIQWLGEGQERDKAIIFNTCLMVSQQSARHSRSRYIPGLLSRGRTQHEGQAINDTPMNTTAPRHVSTQLSQDIRYFLVHS